jgi:predicted chitinase
MLTALQIAEALHAPSAAVLANWPHLEMELAYLDGFSERVQIAAAATIKIECPKFEPEREQHNGDARTYFVTKYWDNLHVRRELGNLVADDAEKFCGRGYIQLTGRDNYRRCSAAIGVDLLSKPDLALMPDVAAKIFVWFFKHCYPAAIAGNWIEVRKLVNGGVNGLDDFLSYVKALQSVPAVKAAGNAS